MRPDLQPIVWLGNSREIVRGFSRPVRDEFADELYRLQIGLDPKDWKPMSSVGPGVREIRIARDGQFRILYVTRRPEGIVVLHACRKKTAQTNRSDISIAQRRFSTLTRR